MAKKGMMPVAVDCRFDRTDPDNAAFGSKVTWKPAPPNFLWQWHVGYPDTLRRRKLDHAQWAFIACFRKEFVTGQRVK
ncbi:hypothetical protein NKJ55_13155 [Mesorhizobium sp. M0106]|uniref:hypothetical protein n=1 Tax=Mesorhizobium sp. M0106 TaxID=2956880 RepID=UPI003337C715